MNNDFWAEHAAHMASDKWKVIRVRAKVRAGYRCEFDYGGKYGRCRETTNLIVHHIRYDNLGDEPDEDLKVVCPVHHIVEHLLKEECPACHGPRFPDNQDGPAHAEHFALTALAERGVDLTAKRFRWDLYPSPRDVVAEMRKHMPLCFACYKKNKTEQQNVVLTTSPGSGGNGSRCPYCGSYKTP